MKQLVECDETDDQIYFEAQRKYSTLCGKHSLNNILGRDYFTVGELDEICTGLSDKIINPHRHCCKLIGGDYDANVLLIALQRADC